MTESTAEILRNHRRRSDEARRQLIRQFTASVPVTVMFALTGIGAYAAFATFGIRWAQLAGGSDWEAAVWPIAVTATTAQAFYCRVRLVPGWHAPWAHWVFDAVAVAGIALAGIGNGLRAGGYPHQLHPAVAVLVLAVPEFCLLLSVTMAATFIEAIRAPEPERAPGTSIPR